MTAKVLIMIQHRTSLDARSEPNNYVIEALDAAIGVAAFGVDLSVLFVGSNVKWAIGPQPLKIISALSYYEIETIYLLDNDIQQHFMTMPEVTDHIQIVSNDNVSEFMAQFSQILRMG